MDNDQKPKRILFVFAWLVVGGEETEVRLLAKHLDPARYRLEVVACFRKPNMPEQTHAQLEAMGVPIDRTPYTLSFEDTLAYLREKIAAYDIVIACQAVRDVYPALESLTHRPPLIEHGGLVVEALSADPALAHRLAANLRAKVEREYSTVAVTRQWEALFDEVIAEGDDNKEVVIAACWWYNVVTFNKGETAMRRRTYLAVVIMAACALLVGRDGSSSNGLAARGGEEKPHAPAALTTIPQTPQAIGDDPIIVGAGDIGECGTGGAAISAQLLQTYITNDALTLGDNAYTNGTTQEFQTCYDPYWGPFKRLTHPSPGNHDYYSTNAAPYFAYYGDNAGPAGVGYYSYNVGKWHFVSLNSNVPANYGSAQERWLKQDLATHPATCVAAYWHHPSFSSGSHGNDPHMHDLLQTLYYAHADLILTGHDHEYERFAPQNPDGQLDTVRGMREFVIGTGGASLRPFSTIRANSEARIANQWGIIRLTLHAAAYDWQFITPSGVQDSGSQTCVQ